MPRVQQNQPAPPKGVALKAGGCGNHEVVVPTDELAEFLLPAIDRMNAELNFTEYESDQPKDGAIQIVAERSAKWLGIAVNSIPRRVYSIKAGEFRACTVRHADALLLACDVLIEDTTITHLPHGLPAAIEMIEAYNAENGIRPRRGDVVALARKLVRFKNGYLGHEKYQAQAEAKLESERWLEERAAQREEAELVAA